MFGFGRKARTIYSDSELGKLEYQDGVWVGNAASLGLGDVLVSLEGSTERPAPPSILQAKEILRQLPGLQAAAREFLQTQDLGEWSASLNGEFVLDGFHSSAEQGRFELQFGLSEWPDAVIVVLFRNDKAADVQLSD